MSKGKGINNGKCFKLYFKLNLFWINYDIELSNK